jgi:DNA helicase II / ATP-dependent DNA helicase PcrA
MLRRSHSPPYRPSPVPSPSSLATLHATLRPGQRDIAHWQGGPLAVAAVPGAGKSTGMAVAAAVTIAQHHLHARRQLLVVTFTRSAAANIKAKIRGYLTDLGLPLGGFVVQTLHGLAWTIARSAPDLSGLNADSLLITPTKGHRLLRTSIEQWIIAQPQLYQRLLEGHQFDGEETERLRRQSVLRTEVLPELANTVIHEAKSSGLLPQDLLVQSQVATDDYAVLAIAAGLYRSYQAQLTQRNWIDYDDMMLAALRVLADAAVCRRWQSQIFAVFEDEAQDSSPLQTRLLEILAASPDGDSAPNLIRVGDPNQAINSTFTPADPRFFREFCTQCAAQQRLATMQQAGRSTPRIMDAANFVLRWVNASPFAGDELPFRDQQIQPVTAGDPQPNPPPTGGGLELHTPEDTFQTVQWIGQRAMALFQANPDHSAAVLVRFNEQGRFIAKELRRWHGDDLAVYEVGQRDRQSQVPAELLALLNFIDRPHSPDYLKAALRTVMERRRIPTQDLNALTAFPEQFLYPGPLDIAAAQSREGSPAVAQAVAQARQFCRALLRSRLELPPYQLIPFLALSLYGDSQTELATADKLAERVAQQTAGDRTWGSQALPAILAALNDIVSAEQFEPVDADNPEERYNRPNQLTIITMHKAKGLDWDYVFLPFLHENVIPGSQWIPPQARFLGDFTLAELARAQVRAMVHGEPPPPDTTTAWERAKQLKTAEEFRLLYVAMTRAKRLLWMSAARKAPFVWSKPDQVDERQPCPVIPALRSQFPGAIVR